jgi:multiple sugar transport system substrate-binding protein
MHNCRYRKKNYSRRRAMKKLSIVLVVFFLISTSIFGSGEGEETTEGKVTLTFWHNFSEGTETDYMAETIIPLFEERNPGISIEAVAQGNDQYNNLIITALGTGSTPDIARVDLTDLANYADLGGVIALDDMPGFKTVADSLFPGPLSTALYKGKYYGLPLGTNTKVAVCNMDAMKKLGFDQVPDTMEAFIAASKEKSSGEPSISVSSVGEWDILPYIWLFGGNVTDPGYHKASGYFDGEDTVKAVKQIKQLYEDKVLAIKELDGTADAWDGIQTGKYAMILEGPWFFTFISDYAEKNIKPAVIPSWEGSTSSIVGGEDIVVFQNSKHPEKAFSFIKFLLSEEIQVMMGAHMGQMPVNMKAAKDPTIADDPIWSVYLTQLQTAKARIPSPRKQLIQDYEKDAMMLIFNEEKPVKESLSQAAKLIDEELAK